ncbi:hypothetical protein Dac01nite_01640 [Demequina activiva]|uniref:HTH marR-type domain-containing protein n=1 Tax=Demequina activiva TaxID=1582364 RepID=A0A919UF91_9MICO|nr:hypothetical protein Dac01nite_01640 [Demequina activiva]
MRHAERESRRQGRAIQDGLVMTAVQAHYAQYLVWAKRGLAMSALAEHTRTTAANVTQVVARMERHGLVRRERSSTDGRSVVARITARGAHQFWLLLARLRGVESRHRADAPHGRTTSLAAALRRLAPPRPRLAPDPPPMRRRARPRSPAGP